MGTTGAPWNIPFVEPTDIPRTYPEDSEDLALAIAAGLSAAGNPGIGSNVVQTVKTNVFTSTSTSFTNVTGLSASITPTTATSKILVVAYVNLSGTQNFVTGAYFRLVRGTTPLLIGDAASSRIRATGGIYTNDGFSVLGGTWAHGYTPVLLDSPGVATATTYSVQVACSANTVFINSSGQDSNNTGFSRTASSITLIEVAP